MARLVGYIVPKDVDLGQSVSTAGPNKKWPNKWPNKVGRPTSTQSWPKVDSKSTQRRPKADPQSIQRRANVDPKLTQSRFKVNPTSAQRRAKVDPHPIQSQPKVSPIQVRPSVEPNSTQRRPKDDRASSHLFFPGRSPEPPMSGQGVGPFPAALARASPTQTMGGAGLVWARAQG